MKTNEEIAKLAKEYHMSKGYMCSEAVVRAINEGMELNLPLEVLSSASSFGGGMGGGCLCGALSGGQLVLGAVIGRTSVLENPSRIKIASAELYDYFKSYNKATCCRVLTAKFDKSKGEHKPHCAKLVMMVSEKVSEILEKNI